MPKYLADPEQLAEIEINILQALIEKSAVPVRNLYPLAERWMGRSCAAEVSAVLASLLMRRIIEVKSLRVKAAAGSKELLMALLQ